MTIKGIANIINGSGVLVTAPNDSITYTSNLRDVLPVTASTDGTGYFEITITGGGEWQHDKIITSEIVDLD